MELALLLAITVASGALVLAGLRQGDRSRLDPAGTVFLLVFPLAGAFSVLPGFLLYAVAGALGPVTTPHRLTELVFIWTVNAPVEEIAKYASFLLLSTLLKSIREPQDGALQGAATGLGFGLVENLLYGVSGGWQLLLLRSLVSLPGHVIYGAVWGGYHGFEAYQGGGRVQRWWIPLLALLPATFAHALFNTLVTVRAPLEVALLGDGLTLGFGVFLFLRLRAVSPSQLRRPLKEWRLAIPELEHALALNPRSAELRRRLAAYLLVADRPQDALVALKPLGDDSWTQFYRQAASYRQDAASAPPPPEASLNPKLFRLLSGG